MKKGSDNHNVLIETGELYIEPTEPSLIVNNLIDSFEKDAVDATEIDILSSFIMKTGVSRIDALIAGKGQVRIISGTYMGITEYEALTMLCKDNIEVRLITDDYQRLHAKAYFFKIGNETVLYVGSSNISRSALTNGIEWNVRLTSRSNRKIIERAKTEFNRLWSDARPFNPKDPSIKELLDRSPKIFTPLFLSNSIYDECQDQLLLLIQKARTEGNYRNLIVAATGIGKTVLSAKDFEQVSRQKNLRLLFTAHLGEIIEKSLETFRKRLNDENFGVICRSVDDIESNAKDNKSIFVSIQTLNTENAYKKFGKKDFDYIIIDEVHHVKAPTYTNIVEYFTPTYLLGLTATPERMDGQDIKQYFNNTITAEYNIHEAIRDGILVPFHYYGLEDSRFVQLRDIDPLSKQSVINGLLEANDVINFRIEKMLEAVDDLTTLDNIRQLRCLCFCSEISIAKKMTEAMNKKLSESPRTRHLTAKYIVGSSKKAERSAIPEQIEKGEVNFLFTVDLYNEGVDLPPINTIFLLRPTESLTIFVQQIGRGLRLYDKKKALTIVDFVGLYKNTYSVYSEKFYYLTGKRKPSDALDLIKQGRESTIRLENDCTLEFRGKSQQYILDYIKAARDSLTIQSYYNKLVRDEGDVSFSDLLSSLSIDFRDYYSRYKTPFYILNGKRKSRFSQNDWRILFRISMIDSKSFAEAVISLLNGTSDRSNRMKNYAEMLLFSFYADKIKDNIGNNVWDFIDKIRSEKDLCDEILFILSHSIESMAEGKSVDLGFEHNLELHKSYYLKQVGVNIGISSFDKNSNLVSGYIARKNSNIAIIHATLNEDQYDDRFIDAETFHWESADSTTESILLSNLQRCDHHILLIRQNKLYNGITKADMPYVFLGVIEKTDYWLKQEGSDKGIFAEWNLEEPIPDYMQNWSKAKTEEEVE